MPQQLTREKSPPQRRLRFDTAHRTPATPLLPPSLQIPRDPWDSNELTDSSPPKLDGNDLQD